MVARVSVLTLLLSLMGLMGGCYSSRPSSSPDASPSPTRIPTTPDSQATLPRPLFYRSSSPIPARPQPDVPTEAKLETAAHRSGGRIHQPPAGASPRATVEVIGGRDTSKRAHWGLMIHSVVPDRSSLSPNSFVNLFGKKMMMQRGESWRTLHRENDSLHEKRFVPLSARDVHRLAHVDTVSVILNRTHYQLPSRFRRELHALHKATPDSLSPDTAQVNNQLTVFYSPENDPAVQGGVSALVTAMSYPADARKELLEGTVQLGFLIEPNGSPSHIQILRPAHPTLTAAAVRGLKQLRFNPGTHGGRPVPVWRTMPVTYNVR